MRRTASSRLAARVVAGTGRAGAVRVAVLVAAMAVAVAAGLVIAFVPALAAHRTDVASARSLSPASAGVGERFRASAVDASVGDQPLRRIFIAAPPSIEVPPGAGVVPQPGQVLASPALQALLEDEPFVASFVPGEVVGTVSPAGLTSPEELFAYVGVKPSEDLNPAAGFGGTATIEGDTFSFVVLQLALFVLVPAAGFLIVSSTLSSQARSQRWDAMRSLSVPESTIGHVAATETGLTSIAGGAIGLGLFTLIRIPLTGAGFGGMHWFPADLRLTPAIAVATLALVAGTGAILGRRAARLHSTDSLHDRNRPVRPALRGLPLTCGVAMLITVVLVRHTGRTVNSAPILLVGAGLSVVGLGLVLVPFVQGVGGIVARRSRRLGWRLGGHRAAYEPRSIVRILAGLVALTVVGHVTFAVLADARLVVRGDLERIVASTEASDLSPDRVDDLVGLRPSSAAIGGTIIGDPDSASTAYLDCKTLERLVATGKPCVPGVAYRVADTAFPSDLEPARTYRFATRDGGSVAIKGPMASATDQFGVFDTRTIIVAGDPPTDSLAVTEVRYLVERSDLIRLESDVARLDPQATVSTNIEVEKIESYDQQLAVARVGAVIGALLATLSFAVASVDRLLERRSHTATLVAIGVSRRVLRTSQIAQLLLPMIAALAIANLVGWLIAQSYLAVGGIVQGVPYGLLVQALGVSAIAVLIAGAVGAIISVPDDIITHLQNE